MGHFKVTTLLGFKCLNFKTHTHDPNCYYSFKLWKPFNLYIYMKIDNTLLWENMKHLQQVQNGIESL